MVTQNDATYLLGPSWSAYKMLNISKDNQGYPT